MSPSIQSLSPLAVGEITISLWILGCAVYLLWLFTIRKDEKELFWAGIVCLGSCLFAATDLRTYIVDEGAALSLFEARTEMAALLLMQWSTFNLAYTIGKSAASELALRRGGQLKTAVLAGTLFWGAVLYATPWVVGAQSVQVLLRFHPHPVTVAADALLSSAFYAWCILVALVAWVWLLRSLPREGWADRILLMAIPLCLAAGLHDTYVLSTPDTLSYPFMLEAGLAFVAFCLFARTMHQHERHHLAESESRARAERALDFALSSSPEPIAICGSEVLFVNKAWLALSGSKGPGDLLGKSAEGLLGEENRSLLSKLLSEEGGARIFPASVESSTGAMISGAAQAQDPGASSLQPSKGERRQYELSSMRFDYREKNARLIFARDVTELHRMRVQMMAMDRVAAIGTLAAGVAHEINNPLAYVHANLELALEDLARCEAPEGAQSLQHLEPILRDALEGATRIARIVGDLGDTARGPLEGTESEQALIDVLPCLQASVRLVQKLAEHRAELHTDLLACGKVRMVEGRLSQVVINLLTNAIAAIPEEDPRFDLGAQVSLPLGRGRAQAREERDPGPPKSARHRIALRCFLKSAGVGERQGSLFQAERRSARALGLGSSESRPCEPETKMVVIEVEDDGEGISLDNQKRIFDPFFTTKPVGQGTGLGLAICQNIVRESKGRLEVESSPGKGSLFRVTLPLVELPEGQKLAHASR